MVPQEKIGRLNPPARMTPIVSTLLGLVKPYQGGNPAPDQQKFYCQPEPDADRVGVESADLWLASLSLGSLEFVDFRRETFFLEVYR